MAQHVASHAVTSVGFIGSGRLAERIARDLVKKIAPRKKFCYRKQRLVATLLASDPSSERRQVFDTLGFTTTETNQRILSDCDVVFLGTSSPDALRVSAAGVDVDRLMGDHARLQQTLFVSLMGDLPADQIERMLCPGARVIRMMPHNYLEQLGLPKGILPPSSWATVRGTHASPEDVEQLMALTGISTHVEVHESAQNRPEPPLDSQEGVIQRIVRTINSQRSMATVAAATAPSGHADEAHENAEGGALPSDDDSNSVTDEFKDIYEMGEFLGRGHFSQVFKVTHKETGQVFAVKCLKNDDLTKEGREMLVAEVGALNRLKHPHVISHHGFYSEGDSYYLVLDYCAGGGLERVLKDSKFLPEAQAKRVIRQVLSALEYCHSMGQIHRDVKAENILLSHEIDGDDNDFHVKLADFGLSEELELGSGRLQQICGTPQYLSPEIVSGRVYGKPADIWAAGILSYMLLSGKIPFIEARSQQDLYKLISLGAIWFGPRDWGHVSRAGKDFVQRMLEISPDVRATATELLAHEWLRDEGDANQSP
ncbi:Camk protein kinase [Globisporangium polare]